MHIPPPYIFELNSQLRCQLVAVLIDRAITQDAQVGLKPIGNGEKVTSTACLMRFVPFED